MGNVGLGFDRRVRLKFYGSKISSDGRLLLFRALGGVLGLHYLAGGILRDTRTGHNRLHTLVGLLCQSWIETSELAPGAISLKTASGQIDPNNATIFHERLL